MDEEFVSPRTQLRGRGCGRGVDGRAGGERAAAGIGRRRCADRAARRARCSTTAAIITNGGAHTRPPAQRRSPASCAAAPHWRPPPACRNKRLDALFAFLQRKGIDQHRAVRLTPASRRSNDIAGLNAPTARLLDKNGLHAGGWHGTVTDVGPAGPSASPRPRSSAPTSSARAASPRPGIGTLRRHAAPPPQALNRLGKASVEGGVGPVYFHNHHGRVRRQVRRQRRRCKTAWQILMERTDARYVAAEIDAFWSSDAYDDVHRHADRGADQPVPDARQDAAHQGRHQRRRAAAARPTAARGSPSRHGHGRGRLPADLRRGQEPRAVLPPGARRRHASPTPTISLHEPQGRRHVGRPRPSSACPRRSRPRRPARPVPPRR